MVNYLVISGTIVPPTSIRCGDEKEFPRPSLSYAIESFEPMVFENAQIKLDSVENTEIEGYWKLKLISTMVSSQHIISVSFLPMEYGKETILFVQREQEKAIGFVAPYLSEDELEVLGVTQQVITGWEEVLTQLDEDVLSEIQNCLACFKQDTTSMGLALTYQTPEGYKTCSWVKY